MNGMSMVSINGAIDSTNVVPIKELGANWAATIPFAFMPSHTSPELSFDLIGNGKVSELKGQEITSVSFMLKILPLWLNLKFGLDMELIRERF